MAEETNTKSEEELKLEKDKIILAKMEKLSEALQDALNFEPMISFKELAVVIYDEVSNDFNKFIKEYDKEIKKHERN